MPELPDGEEVVRRLLRHLRRAHHELMLARDIGGFLVRDDVDNCVDSVRDLVRHTEAELTRLRNQN